MALLNLTVEWAPSVRSTALRRSAAAVAFAICLTSLLIRPEPAAAQAAPTEYEVKAAFLLNFARFVQWPDEAFPSPDAPLTVCIVGRDPFGPAIETMMQGQTAAGRTVVVRRAAETPPLGACQIVFFARSAPRVAQTLSRLGPGILTVGESDDFLEDGGMIHFVLVGQRVRFDVNARSAAAAGLRFSSQLLRVARSVQ